MTLHTKRGKRLPRSFRAKNGKKGSGGLSKNLLRMMGVIVVLLVAVGRHVASPRNQQ